MKWFIIPLFFVVANAVNANAWIKCEGCSSPQMLAKSQLHVLEGEAVVYDAAIPTALRFSNTQVVVGGPECQQLRPILHRNLGIKIVARAQLPSASAANCRIEIVSNSEPLTLEDATLLNALHAIHTQTNGRMKSVIELRGNEANFGPGPITSPGGNPGFGPSAADYANNAVFRATVDNFASQFTLSSPSISTLIANAWIQITQPWNVITSAAGTLWLGEDATITVVITFEDGSKVVLDFEFETPDIAHVNAVKDAEGRDIMTASNLGDFSNTTLRFPNGGSAALENWIQNAIHLGIPVVGVTSPIAPGGCRRIVDGVSCQRLH